VALVELRHVAADGRHLLVLELGSGGALEVVAAKDGGIHGEGLVDVGVVRGQFFEGLAVGEDLGPLVGKLVVLHVGVGVDAAAKDRRVDHDRLARIGVIRGKFLKLGAVCQDLSSLLGLLVGLGLICRGTIEVVAAKDRGIHDNGLVDVGVVRGQLLEGLAVGEDLGPLVGELVVLLLDSRGAVEVAPSEDGRVHGDGLLRAAVVRGQLLEGRGVGEDAGSLLGFLLGLDLGRGSAVEVVPAEDLGGYLDGSRAGVVRGELSEGFGVGQDLGDVVSVLVRLAEGRRGTVEVAPASGRGRREDRRVGGAAVRDGPRLEGQGVGEDAAAFFDEIVELDVLLVLALRLLLLGTPPVGGKPLLLAPLGNVFRGGEDLDVVTERDGRPIAADTHEDGSVGKTLVSRIASDGSVGFTSTGSTILGAGSGGRVRSDLEHHLGKLGDYF